MLGLAGPETAHAVWQDSRNGNADILFSTLGNGAAAWAANVKISDDPGFAAQTMPRIGIDIGGNLTMAWLDARTTPARVRAARRGVRSMNVQLIVALIAVLLLAFFVFGTTELLALWGGRSAVPARLVGLVPEGLEATGAGRIVGIIFSSLVVVGTQAFALYVLVQRGAEIGPPGQAMLLVELALALGWLSLQLRKLRTGSLERRVE